jgi:hypothetical protein
LKRERGTTAVPLYFLQKGDEEVIYTVGDFIHNLKGQGVEAENMQSDKAVEAINECLPRNLMVTRLFREEKDESIMDAHKFRERR